MNSTINSTSFQRPVNEEAESLITSLEYSILELSLIGISMSVGSLLTILGNIFVFVIYAKTKSLQTPKNYFILSLAVADIIIAAIPVNLYTVYMLYGYWPLGHILCNAWLIIDYWACTVSTLTLLAIAFDRFSATCFPLSHRVRQTKSYVTRVIISIWIVAFLVWAPAIVVYPYAHGEHTVADDQCYIQFLLESWHVTFVTAFCSYYGPVLITTILYFSISFKLVQRVSVMRKKRKNSKKSLKRACAISASSSIPIGTNTVPEAINPSLFHRYVSRLESIDSSTKQSMTDISIIPSSMSDISTLASMDNLSTLSTAKSTPNISSFPDIALHSSKMSSLPDIATPGIYTITNKYIFDGEDFTETAKTRSVTDLPRWFREAPSDEINIKKKESKEMKTAKLKRALYKKKKKMSASQTIQSMQMSKSASKKSIRNHKRGIRLLLLVILAFAISWMPYYLSTVVVSITKIRLPEPLWRFCYIIGWFNSLLNPLCYAFGNKKFKKGFKQICKGKKIQ